MRSGSSTLSCTVSTTGSGSSVDVSSATGTSATGTSADAGLHESDLNQALHTAIARLPERCATVFVLSRFEALSYAEIAEQLGISRNTVENQMVKALRLLRTALRDFLPVAIALAVSV